MRTLLLKFIFIALFGMIIQQSYCQPTMVKDINTEQSSFPNTFTDVNGILFFKATVSYLGTELWKTDGTLKGTKLVKDIIPGNLSGDPKNLVNFKGTLFFTANDNIHGVELWKSDGTAEGTKIVKDISPGIRSSSPNGLTVINNILYFGANDEANGNALWKSDGTEAGTILIKAISKESPNKTPVIFVKNNNLIFFTINNEINGTELWKSDGTESGTFQLKDINPGADASGPRNFNIMNGKLYFYPYSPDFGPEIWVTDGSASGTHILKDISTGMKGVEWDNDIVSSDGNLFLKGRTDATGYELYLSDGTPENTKMLADINKGAEPSLINYLTFSGDNLFFSATDGVHGEELWKYRYRSTPTIKADAINFSNIFFTSSTISWTNGNGLKRAVFIALDTAKTSLPVNNTTYTANTALGNGKQIGNSGWYCIYNGIGSTVDLTALTENTKYKVMISEYNDTLGISYLNNDPASFSTISSNSEDINDNKISIFPNPVVENLSIIFTNKPENVSIKLFSANGFLLQTIIAKNNDTKINMSTFSSGVYILKIEHPSGISTKQIVKQ